jgi:hypothetical protein
MRPLRLHEGGTLCDTLLTDFRPGSRRVGTTPASNFAGTSWMIAATIWQNAKESTGLSTQEDVDAGRLDVLEL